MVEGFHGVPSAPWNEAPTTAPDWRHAAGQLVGLPEPPFHWKPEKNRSAVAATKGPDGRIGPGAVVLRCGCPLRSLHWSSRGATSQTVADSLGGRIRLSAGMPNFSCSRQIMLSVKGRLRARIS